MRRLSESLVNKQMEANKETHTFNNVARATPIRTTKRMLEARFGKGNVSLTGKLIHDAWANPTFIVNGPYIQHDSKDKFQVSAATSVFLGEQKHMRHISDTLKTPNTAAFAQFIGPGTLTSDPLVKHADLHCALEYEVDALESDEIKNLPSAAGVKGTVKQAEKRMEDYLKAHGAIIDAVDYTADEIERGVNPAQRGLREAKHQCTLGKSNKWPEGVQVFKYVEDEAGNKIQ